MAVDMNIDESPSKLFNEIRIYSKQVFKNELLPAFKRIKFDGLSIYFEIGIDLSKYSTPAVGYPFFKLNIIDPYISYAGDIDKCSPFTLYVNFNNLDFESITSFEIVKRIVKLEKVSEEKAHQELKKSFEEYTNHKINDLYRKIQLMNLEII